LLVSVLFDILGVGCPVIARVTWIALPPGALSVLLVFSVEGIALQFVALPVLATLALAGD
jgi:hypothetical protein